MDVLVTHADLQRRNSTRVAETVLEAAITQAFGFPVQIRGLELWISPGLFDEGRVPERYVLPALLPDLRDPPKVSREGTGSQMRLMPPPKDVMAIPSAREMVRRHRDRQRGIESSP